jgi:predicted amidophosphoribosyltransferase
VREQYVTGDGTCEGGVLRCRQPPDTKHKYCNACGEPATDIICRSCQAKIQGEAAHRKQQIEKQAKTDTSRK